MALTDEQKARLAATLDRVYAEQEGVSEETKAKAVWAALRAEVGTAKAADVALFLREHSRELAQSQLQGKRVIQAMDAIRAAGEAEGVATPAGLMIARGAKSLAELLGSPGFTGDLEALSDEVDASFREFLASREIAPAAIEVLGQSPDDGQERELFCRLTVVDGAPALQTRWMTEDEAHESNGDMSFDQEVEWHEVLGATKPEFKIFAICEALTPLVCEIVGEVTASADTPDEAKIIAYYEHFARHAIRAAYAQAIGLRGGA